MAEPQFASAGESRPTGVRPIAPRSLVELVVAEIRRSLLDRSLVPGASFSITELSDRLGVSHIPVREALRRLETEGLIELRHSRSARVAPMSREDLLEVFHLRVLVEGDAMARAVRAYTSEDLVSIEQAWTGLLVLPDDEPEDVFARHRLLHQLLVAPGVGRWDRRFLEILWRATERYIALIILERDLSGSPAGLRDAHRGLLDAAVSRSPAGAKRAVREHSEAAIAFVTELLDGVEVGARRKGGL